MRKRNRTENYIASAFAAVLGTVCASAGHTAEISAEMSTGVGVSDNIYLTDANQQSETMLVAGLKFGLEESSRKLTASVRSNFDYIHYQDNSFDNEVVGGLDGQADVVVIEDRINWAIRNTFGQQFADPLSAARPDNRENVNFFTTGPDLMFSLGSRNSLDVDLRYSKVNYETRPYDNDRRSGSARLSRKLRPGKFVSVNFTAERVEFDRDDLSAPYNRYESYLGYQGESGRNKVSIDAGFSEVDLAASSDSGPLFRINWTRKVSPNSTVTVGGGTRYSDQGDIFRLGQESSDDFSEPADAESTGDPFRNDFFNAAYNLTRGATVVQLSGNLSNEVYEDGVGLDRDVLRVDASIARDLGKRFYAEAQLGIRDRDYKFVTRNDQDSRIAVQLGYRVGPALSVMMEIRHSERSSNDSSAEYSDNRFFVTAAYSPAWGR